MQRRCVSPQELEYYRGNLREAICEDGVVCPECGTLHSRLGRHVAVHRLTLRAYRAKWGYARKARLAIPYPLKGVLHPTAALPRALEYYRTHQAGLAPAEIAAQVGLHPRNVAERLRRLGLKSRPAMPPRHPAPRRDRGGRPHGAARPRRRS